MSLEHEAIEPQKVNIVLSKGADFRLPLTVYQEDATNPEDLSGWYGIFSATSKEEVVLEDGASSAFSVQNIAPTDALSGGIELFIPRDETENVATLNHPEDYDFRYNYVYDFYLENDTTGERKPLLYGELALRPSTIGL